MAVYPLTAPELARRLGLPPEYLRQLIRTHRLVGARPRYQRYSLGEDDVARISAHPAVRMAVAGRREREGPDS